VLDNDYMQFYENIRQRPMKMREYTIGYEPFSVEHFQVIALDMVADFFSTGVRVNGVSYTLEGGTFPVVGGKDHIPALYHDGSCMLFFAEILFPVSEEVFSDEEQMDLIAQISELSRYDGGLKDITFRTSSARKMEVYSPIIEEYTGVCIVNQSVSETEIQGNVQQIALDKVVRGKTLEENHMLIAEDTSLEFAGLGGAPGPYIKQFMGLNPPQYIDEIITRLRDNRCMYESCMAVKYKKDSLTCYLTSTIRCSGFWKLGSHKESFEDSFQYQYQVYGFNSAFPQYGDEKVLFRIAVFWMLFRYMISKPGVKLKKRVVVKKTGQDIT